MSTPETNLRIFVRPSMEEIVFPDNSATFVDFKLEQIDEGTQIVRDVNGNLRDLSNPAFRKYILSLSCTDNRLPPLAGLWAGDVVDVELPGEIAERGATPSRTAVAGTITVAGGYVRYRPRLTMMVRSAPALSGVEWRGGAAGWSFELEEANGAADVPESTDRLILTARSIQSANIGDAVSVNYNADLTRLPAGQTVTWAVVLGALPPGLSLNAATGVVSGIVTGSGGVYAFALSASATNAVSTQTYVWNVATPSVTFAPVAAQTHVPGTAFSLNLAPSVSVSNGDATPTFSLVSGSLPAGLTLSSAGVISGTPTAAGAFSVVVRTSIASGFSDDQRVAFYASLPTISSNGVALQNYTVGTAYSINLSSLVDVTGTSASPTFALILGTLPAGLTLSGGVLSGTPTSYGAFAVTFSATLSTGQNTEVTVAFFAQAPDGNQIAVFSGGTNRTWTDESGVSMVASDMLASGSFVVATAGWTNLTGCGGGAGGGNINNNNGSACGGGGAGQFIDRRVWLAAGTYTVSIAASAAPGTQGNVTTITGPGGFSITLAGGGRGADAYGSGVAGASGGGGSGRDSSIAGGAATSTETGTAGGVGNGTSTNRIAAGGGGFSTPGQASSGTSAGMGGGGIRKKLWAWLDFCGGGGGGTNTGAGGLGQSGGGNGGVNSGNGSAAAANSGSGGGGAGNRTNGSAVIVGGAGGSGRFIVWGRVAS